MMTETELSHERRIEELQRELEDLRRLDHQRLVSALQLLVQSSPHDPEEIPTTLGAALMKVGLIS